MNIRKYVIFINLNCFLIRYKFHSDFNTPIIPESVDYKSIRIQTHEIYISLKKGIR